MCSYRFFLSGIWFGIDEILMEIPQILMMDSHTSRSKNGGVITMDSRKVFDSIPEQFNE